MLGRAPSGSQPAAAAQMENEHLVKPWSLGSENDICRNRGREAEGREGKEAERENDSMMERDRKVGKVKGEMGIKRKGEGNGNGTEADLAPIEVFQWCLGLKSKV